MPVKTKRPNGLPDSPRWGLSLAKAVAENMASGVCPLAYHGVHVKHVEIGETTE